MTGEKRREQILSAIQQAPGPVPGAALAQACHVSRQVIVQDIALLRAARYPILSTTRGYVLQSRRFSRVFRILPPADGLKPIFFTIVDNGGRVRNLFQPGTNGSRLELHLNLHARSGVQAFLQEMTKPEGKLLRILVSQPHCQTVEADSKAVLDRIEEALSAKGYLAGPSPQK